jgi:electron transport protein HydN
MEIVETGEMTLEGEPRRVAIKCDLCAGVADSPACVRVCLTDALELVTESALSEELDGKRKAAVTGAWTQAKI